LTQPLHALAAAAGVDVRYVGWRGEPVEASQEALLAILAALGHPVSSPDDAPAALAAAERAWWGAGAPPVIVSWGGAAADLPLRVRADVDGEWEVEVAHEDGSAGAWRGRLYELAASGHVDRDGAVWCQRHVALPAAPAHGYHRVRWRCGGAAGHALWIAAPERAFGAPPLEGVGPRSWGAFAPLYALRSARSGGAGDLAELSRLARHLAARGGRWVATLPMLAAFLDEPCEPSPYAPASRLAWNELYLDLAAQLGDAYDAPAVAAERARLLAEPQVDYRGQYRWRRALIDRAAEAAWQGPARAALEAFARDPARAIGDYAAFRAIGEVTRAPWSRWPEVLRAAPAFDVDALLAGDVAGLGPAAAASWRAHVWSQWAMDGQLGALKAAADAGEAAALYLDLPVGVNRDAWEVWRQRELFLLDASAGAPPDALFLGGQDWGLPPLHPERIRTTGWDYVIRCVRHHVRHAGMLRVDHVMGLHRLYCVPAGLRPTDGVYVRYAADELYAILCVESHRAGCAIVGEDLGTVPDYVPPAMRRHGLAGLFVAQFAMAWRAGDALGRAAPTQVACVNTHDTPTFAGWWRGTDLDDQRALGLIDDAAHAQGRVARAEARRATCAAAGVSAAAAAEPDGDAACAEALLGVVRGLAAGDAAVALVTLEDAWLEPAPQNVPGTSLERPNWRRPFALDADAALADPRTEALLAAAARAGG
jgi:4-alpha-glucanotransferase